jgi:DNA-binding response OmpR family regulator
MHLLSREAADAAARVPALDQYGVLWRGDDWVALSPINARLIGAFLAAPGKVLDRRTLGRAGWPDGVPNERSVDSRIKVLRRRVSPLGVRISTVRGHGYLAEFGISD